MLERMRSPKVVSALTGFAKFLFGSNVIYKYVVKRHNESRRISR